MTSNTLTNLAEPAPARPLIPPVGWAWIAALGGMFIAMHWEFIRRMAKASTDPDWSHIAIVPLISIYYIAQNKDRLGSLPRRVCWWGLPIMLLGVFNYAWWIYPGRNDMFRGYSMVLTLFGLVLLLVGPAMMRVLWFAVVYLVFSVKVPDSLWERIAHRLQDIAAVGASAVLEWFAVFLDFGVTKSGNTISLTFMQNGRRVTEGMNIAEACSGLRMLMAFVALGVALAFLWDRSWWQRVIMIAMAVPIALAVNIGRVTVLGLIYLVDKRYAEGDFHVFVGMLMLIPAMGLFLLLGWVLDKVIVADEAAGDEDGEGEGEKEREAQGESTRGLAAISSGLKDELKDKRAIGWGVGLGVLVALVGGLVYAGAFRWLPPLEMAWLFESVPGLKNFADVPIPVATLVPGLLALVAVYLLRKKVAIGAGLRRTAPTLGAALGLLLASTVVIQSVKAWHGVVLLKEELPLRHSLTQLPLNKAGWSFVRDDELPSEQVEQLGTEQYLSRWYEDRNTPDGQPGRFARLHVAYYTGMIDTVPHVPDRCFVAGGAQSGGVETRTLDLAPQVAHHGSDVELHADLPHPVHPGPLGTGQMISLPGNIEATLFTYHTADRDQPQHVVYFFAANGKYLTSPNAVRVQGFDIRDPYSYYCKVEVQIVGETEPDQAVARVQELLAVFLPEILACLPDWSEVQAGQWPSNKEATP